jgi:hypothetical protein
MKRIAKIVVRLLLGGILIYASTTKIGHAEEFAVALANYRVIPSVLILLGSLIVPWLELILGVLLITGAWRSTASFLTALLFLVFTLAVTQALVRGIDISCGCFDLTGTEEKIGSLTILRNLVLFLLSLSIMTGPREVASGRER